MSKVWEFFENMNEAVYASDIDTYELIYLNKTARNLFNFKDNAAYKGIIKVAMFIFLENIYLVALEHLSQILQ